MIGNSRIDPCSKILKRRLLDKYCKSTEGPITRVIGLDWTEVNRFERHVALMKDLVIAPLIDFQIGKPGVMRMVKEAGLPTQRLYGLGFPHAQLRRSLCQGWKKPVGFALPHLS